MLDLLRTLPRVYGVDKFSTVFLGEDCVYRVAGGVGQQVFTELNEQGLLPKLSSYGVIETSVAERFQRNGQPSIVLQHPRIPFVTHPAEWPPAMLRDAAVYLLELAMRLDEHGLMLKDGHLLNVTFHRGRPMFLDFGSITKSSPALQSRWLEEFRCRSWLPLWVASKGRFELANAMLKTEPRGLSFVLAKTKVGAHFPLQFRKIKRISGKEGFRAALASLQNILQGYQIKLDQSRWTRYSERAPEDKARKHDVLLEHLRQRRPAAIHELAGNAAVIGERIAGDLAVPVCTTDIDFSCIESAYVRTKDKNLPLSLGVLNLLFPISPYGAGGCRPGSVQRLKAETTLATALVHHLVAKSQVSMSTFVQLIADYTGQSAIIEWVDPSDKFLVGWVNNGIQIPPEYTLPGFLEACAEHFPRRIELAAHHPTRKLFEFSR